MNFRGGNRKQNEFKGHRGKVKRRQIYKQKKKNSEIIDDEIRNLEGRQQNIDPSACKKFTDFPLSNKTLKGLEFCRYENPTDIQRESIGISIQGHDVLGAAKTGSGKTLAFIIPVLECLFRSKWTQLDGLGALVISPTRELAFQTFEVLKRVGKFHDFSAGLVIGGKPLKEEAGRINRTNIVVCTPGRLLQHMDETTYFTADSLKILVLDEADRILDLGFAQSMNAILGNLPTERQTLLFSATQTRSVKDLARLSLNDPMLVSVHENATESTPEQLEQNYMVCELHEKLNLLWSFLRNHLKSKILVFLTSCKQVKYVYDAFKRLRPGIPLACLHGGMPQLRRVAVYNQFVWKQNACLFATDIAARGLDFPGINWVIQLDCPEDANTYIHRAGRTARYEKDGQSLLILLPSEEEGMVKQLSDKKIPIENIKVNQKKLLSIQNKLESNCAADPTLKECAQRAFVAYLKSVYLMKNKKVFDVHALDIEAFSRSQGLAIAPKVRFLKREQKRLAEKDSSKSISSNSLALASKLTAKVSESSEESDSESESSDESDTSSGEDKSVKAVKRKLEESKAKTSSRSKTAQRESGSAVSKKVPATRKQGDVSSDEDSGSDNSDSGSDSDEEMGSGAENSDKKSFAFDVDPDDGEDGLFKVKRDVNIDELMGITEETMVEKDEPKPEKKSKKLSKFAQAKKIMKKGMTVNSKVQFDETGEMVLDPHRVKKVEAETDHVGGIDIERARQWMKEEDKRDKELFREKIRQRHREERLKKKEERRAQKQQQRKPAEPDDDGEAEVCLPSDNEETGEKADPLSFLPDPDEIYGKLSSDGEEEDSDSQPPSKKQKLAGKQKEQWSFSSDEDDEGSDDDDDDNDDDDDDDSSGEFSEENVDKLADAEQLALRLLHGR